RERCVVYSNFTSADLPVTEATPKGVVALKSFLEYAQTRRLPSTESVEEETDLAFENALAGALVENGCEIVRRVGRGEARVDIAVVDPARNGRYLLGILCDGPNYHESRVARDRDRLRQQILEQLGWKIHRVWSTDWYRNRAETIARLMRAVDAAKQPPPDDVAEMTPEPTDEASDDDASSPLTFPEPDDVPPYETCGALRIPIAGELHLVAAEGLAIAVEDVVTVEGPVHVDEVVRRIRVLWGLQRAGNRIREAVDRAVHLALRRRIIIRDGDFLRMPDAAVRVRRRNGDPLARIDFIADAEISESLRHVLRTQFATPREDLIDAAVRRLGIQATSAAISNRVGTVIAAQLASGVFEQSGELIRDCAT
ncbi:MAG TPA: DUF3320 domain-containing protein, partial [Thermoanaerobaculia bacterium]|nr:DUF3320 domain-containing protein [Thermoanaerobaculia bacterium]